jgi:hypothetical protein
MEICDGTIPTPPLKDEYAAFPYQTIAADKNGLAFCVGDDGKIYCTYLGAKLNGIYNNGSLEEASKWFSVSCNDEDGPIYEKSKIQFLCFNASGTALICMSTTYIHVLFIDYTKVISMIKSRGSDRSKPLTFSKNTSQLKIGDEYIYSTFHPLKDTTIVALIRTSIENRTTDKHHDNISSNNANKNMEYSSNIILYDLSDTSNNLIVTRDWQFQTLSPPSSFTFPQFSQSRIGFGCWELLTIYILLEDGQISAMCPVTPDGAEISGETMSYLIKSVSSSAERQNVGGNNLLDDEAESNKVAKLWLKSSWIDQVGNGKCFTYFESNGKDNFTPMIQTPLRCLSNINVELEQFTRCAKSFHSVNMTSFSSSMHVPTVFTVIYQSGLLQTLIGPLASPKPKWTHIRTDKYLNDTHRKHLLLLQAKLLPPVSEGGGGYCFVNGSGRSDFSFVVGEKSVYMLKMKWLQSLHEYFSSATTNNQDKMNLNLDFKSWKSEFSLLYSNNTVNNDRGLYGLQSILTRRGTRKLFFRLRNSILDVDVSSFLFLNNSNNYKSNKIMTRSITTNGGDNSDSNNGGPVSLMNKGSSLISSIPPELKFDEKLFQKLEDSKRNSWPILSGPINSFDEASKAIVVLDKMKQRIEAYESIQDELKRKNKLWVPLVKNDVKLISQLEEEVAAISNVVLKIDDRCQKIKRSQVALNVKMESLFSILYESKPISDAERQCHIDLRQFKSKLDRLKTTIVQLDNTIFNISSVSNKLKNQTEECFDNSDSNVFLPRRMEKDLLQTLQNNATILFKCKRNVKELKRNIENVGISFETASLSRQSISNSNNSGSYNNCKHGGAITRTLHDIGVKEGKEKQKTLYNEQNTSSNVIDENVHDVGW